MCYRKRIAAAILAVSMVFGSMSAFAADSPSTAPAAGYVDNNTKDHPESIVVSKINSKGSAATVTKVTADTKVKGADTTEFATARTPSGSKVPITVLGDGKKGVFNSKNGKKIKTVKLTSKKQITIKANAFKSSKVKTLRVSSGVSIKKDAFKKTGVKSLTINIQLKKSSSVKVSKGAFNGLSSKAKVVVSKKKMSKSEFNKLKKKLTKAGFKGKIVRK